MYHIMSNNRVAARRGACLSPKSRHVSGRGRRTWLAAASVILMYAALAAQPAAGAPRLGWTAAKIVIRPANNDTRGYAAAAFQGHAYVVDLTDAHAGGNSTSQIWFSTNRSGHWVRTLVAQVPDDPDQNGALMPQITVVPASGHVVIAVTDDTASGAKLLSFSNQSGSWQPLALPLGSGSDAIHDAMAPALAAHGNTVTLAFNATYVDNTAVCSQVEGNIFLSTLTDGGNTWSQPRNVTQDYCKPGLFGQHPVLAYSPSGALYMLYQYSGDPNSLNQLRLRSGTLGANTEEVIEPAPGAGNWGLNGQPGFYALAFDAQGAPHVVYWLGGGGSSIPGRLMYAVRGPGGWQRTVLHQAPKVAVDTDVVALAPAIASGDTGITVAYVGTANYPLGGESSQAVYFMHATGGGWSAPANVTRSAHSDSLPLLASSAGRMQLLMLRDGVDYLYARQLSFPRIVERLTATGVPPAYTAHQPVSLAGSVAPASRPETVRVCLQRKLSAVRWGTCQSQGARTAIQAQAGQFTYTYGSLPAGQYRLRVTVPQTDDHLSGAGAWRVFMVH